MTGYSTRGPCTNIHPTFQSVDGERQYTVTLRDDSTFGPCNLHDAWVQAMRVPVISPMTDAKWWHRLMTTRAQWHEANRSRAKASLPPLPWMQPERPL